ncbi:hypothetical protein [Lyngbya aestuarii]|uniref:hypothetical protein n=1 Tax=Lyngbya aestuarii TaxID=118322 RepID=UPI00403E18F9
MIGSPLKKFVLAPVILSASVFAALTLPLALLGSKTISVQMQKEPVFNGEIRDIATPYLGLATLLSLGAGVASVALTGWQQSARKSAQVEEKLSGLAQQLQEKEEQLKELKLSESRLKTSGLKEFLAQETESSVASSPQSKAKIAPPSNQDQPVALPQIEQVAPAFNSAFTLLNHAQPASPLKPSPSATLPRLSEVEELHSQLQQMMTRIASLESVIEAVPVATVSHQKMAADLQVAEYLNSNSLKVLQSWAVDNSEDQLELETVRQKPLLAKNSFVSESPQSQGNSAVWSQRQPEALRSENPSIKKSSKRGKKRRPKYA